MQSAVMLKCQAQGHSFLHRTSTCERCSPLPSVPVKICLSDGNWQLEGSANCSGSLVGAPQMPVFRRRLSDDKETRAQSFNLKLVVHCFCLL